MLCKKKYGGKFDACNVQIELLSQSNWLGGNAFCSDVFLVWSTLPAEAQGKRKGKGRGEMERLNQADENVAPEKVREAADEVSGKVEEKAAENADNGKKIREGAKKAKEKNLENMKEADKGSEQGKAMREQHRRKWWKFWGE